MTVAGWDNYAMIVFLRRWRWWPASWPFGTQQIGMEAPPGTNWAQVQDLADKFLQAGALRVEIGNRLEEEA